MGEVMAGARGSLPVVSEAVNTSWGVKTRVKPGAWGQAFCLEGPRGDTGPVLRVWERKHSPVLS